MNLVQWVHLVLNYVEFLPYEFPQDNKMVTNTQDNSIWMLFLVLKLGPVHFSFPSIVVDNDMPYQDYGKNDYNNTEDNTNMVVYMDSKTVDNN
mmetsp:Transcript_111104/g.166363  ORF Transcript_111104/g.166363 Transcript_111104/m.166363 type:complete len:93 (-) Transcript_111104:174-452(-)